MDDLADSATLIVLARIAMALSAPAFAIVGWLLVRSVDTVDALDAKVESVRQQVFETNASIKVMQQAQTTQALVLSDHETRMRVLERMAHAPQ